ncbi:TPA: hypothetical protein DEP90_02080, partial [Patescibacteria group bacterium]|nr:hypothetical protein [Patescibacteria group bacterium]
MKKCKILVITAHPDDAELMFGGLINKYTRNDHEVEILIVTSGENWNKLGNNNVEEVKRTRRDEAKAAAKVLGAKKVRFMDYKDGFVNRYELFPKLVDEIRKSNPNYILTHAVNEGHFDHKEIGYTVQRVCNIEGEPAPIINPYWESKYKPVSSFKGFYTSNPIKLGINDKSVFVSLQKKDIKKKIESILCHKSQFPNEKEVSDRIMLEARF